MNGSLSSFDVVFRSEITISISERDNERVSIDNNIRIDDTPAVGVPMQLP